MAALSIWWSQRRSTDSSVARQRILGDRPDDDVAIRHHSGQFTILLTNWQRTDVLVSHTSCRFAARCTRVYHVNPLRYYLVCTLSLSLSLSLSLPSCSASHVRPFAWRPIDYGQSYHVLGPSAEADAP